ncbi:hypothetical protein GOODEAATRI_029373 [Goodea atripinnis]|uniref:Uncharacterized protein n=1 Tax=Goodea atripinnis TaxID=208336 RepID=A0ABV0P8P8_9TELE
MCWNGPVKVLTSFQLKICGKTWKIAVHGFLSISSERVSAIKKLVSQSFELWQLNTNANTNLQIFNWKKRKMLPSFSFHFTIIHYIVLLYNRKAQPEKKCTDVYGCKFVMHCILKSILQADS